MIDLKEAIETLESGSWCSIAYISYDRKKAEAGRIVRIPKCRYTRSTSRSSTGPALDPGTTKRQNHGQHFTANVITPSNQIRKVHYRLLFEINGKKIL